MIVPNLYISRREFVAKGHGFVRDRGFDRIISLIPMSPISGDDLEHVIYPMSQYNIPPMTEIGALITRMIEWIDEGRRIVIHCGAGACRSPAIVACYLVAANGLDFEEAIELVKLRRGRVLLGDGYRQGKRMTEMVKEFQASRDRLAQ